MLAMGVQIVSARPQPVEHRHMLNAELCVRATGPFHVRQVLKAEAHLERDMMSTSVLKVSLERTGKKRPPVWRRSHDLFDCAAAAGLRHERQGTATIHPIRDLIQKMRKWLVLPAALAVVFITAIGLWQLSKARSFQLLGDIVARIETSAPRVAITFDDGPTADYTEPVLALLAAHDVRATFFVTGREVEENPDEARAIVDAGHELGNHSWSHPDMTLLGPARIAREIERTDEAIRAAGHQGEIFFRPPFGKKLMTLPWYLSRNGRTTIM